MSRNCPHPDPRPTMLRVAALMQRGDEEEMLYAWQVAVCRATVYNVLTLGFQCCALQR